MLPRLPILATLSTLLALTGCAAESEAVEPEPIDMATAMAKMVEYATPGEPHAAMAASAGSWNVEGLSYWEPGAEPMPMKATAERTLLLGGRVLQETFKSEFMGAPFEGILLQGYDNMKGEHWSIWMDSMNTWASFSRGNHNESGELVLEGLMCDAMTPEGRLMRTVVRVIDADHVNMQMLDVAADGSTSLAMELDYTRAR
jgi:hypothetical protein